METAISSQGEQYCLDVLLLSLVATQTAIARYEITSESRKKICH
jgi:hypothetical protein